jgi:hypothetical protein
MLIRLLADLEGEAMVSRPDPAFLARVSRRFSAEGLIAERGNAEDVRGGDAPGGGRVEPVQRAVPVIAAAARTMLTSRQARQVEDSVRIPPSNRPMAPPAPASALNTPKARARSRTSVNVVVRSAKAEGASSAAKSPCSARAVTRNAKSPAKPPGAEAAAKPMRPRKKRSSPTEEVRQSAAEQEEAAECEGVGGDDPLSSVVDEAEVGLRGWQGDVHDGRIQRDQRLGDPDADQGQPAMLRSCVRICHSSAHGCRSCAMSARAVSRMVV